MATQIAAPHPEPSYTLAEGLLCVWTLADLRFRLGSGKFDFTVELVCELHVKTHSPAHPLRAKYPARAISLTFAPRQCRWPVHGCARRHTFVIYTPLVRPAFESRNPARSAHARHYQALLLCPRIHSAVDSPRSAARRVINANRRSVVVPGGAWAGQALMFLLIEPFWSSSAHRGPRCLRPAAVVGRSLQKSSALHQIPNHGVRRRFAPCTRFWSNPPDFPPSSKRLQTQGRIAQSRAISGPGSCAAQP